MAPKIKFKQILKTAKEKGYFSLSDFSNLKLTAHEFQDLRSFLNKKKIPFEANGTNFTQEEATEIVNCLRRGIPPSVDVTKFSVGRRNLIQKLTLDLQKVSEGRSKVCFMNADYGHGKTHSLHLLREIAFKKGFVVSIVTLSQSSCPIHDFMSVYNKIMWNLRIQGERNNPALEKVLSRWLDAIRGSGEESARKIVRTLPDDLKSALQIYHESDSPIKPDEEKRIFILKYLSGEQISLRELRRFGIINRIDSSTALSTLGHMASLFKNLGYKGICILFDEADPIHSFARFDHQDRAYNNLFRIVQQSTDAPNCYFLYATTPSFFDNYSHYWPASHKLREENILELEGLSTSELTILSGNLCTMYSVYKNRDVHDHKRALLKELAGNKTFADSLGNFVRKCIVILDESI